MKAGRAARGGPQGDQLEGLLDQLGAAVGDVFASVPVQVLILGTVTYATIVWLAATHWVFHDMRRRRPEPTTPYLAALAIVLATPVLLPVSVFTYRILRPRETLADARERELSERLEELDSEIDLACPGCALAVEDDWLICPDCRTRLAHRCRTCGRTMGLDWAVCGWCGAEFGAAARPRLEPGA